MVYYKIIVLTSFLSQRNNFSELFDNEFGVITNSLHRNESLTMFLGQEHTLKTAS